MWHEAMASTQIKGLKAKKHRVFVVLMVRDRIECIDYSKDMQPASSPTPFDADTHIVHSSLHCPSIQRYVFPTILDLNTPKPF